VNTVTAQHLANWYAVFGSYAYLTGIARNTSCRTVEETRPDQLQLSTDKLPSANSTAWCFVNMSLQDTTQANMREFVQTLCKTRASDVLQYCSKRWSERAVKELRVGWTDHRWPGWTDPWLCPNSSGTLICWLCEHQARQGSNLASKGSHKGALNNRSLSAEYHVRLWVELASLGSVVFAGDTGSELVAKWTSC